MSAGQLCPAILHDRAEDRVICARELAHVPGAWTFICWRCLEAMLKEADDRQAVRREWEIDQ